MAKERRLKGVDITRFEPGLIWIRSHDPESVTMDKKLYERLENQGYAFMLTGFETDITRLSDEDLKMVGLMRAPQTSEEKH